MKKNKFLVGAIVVLLLVFGAGMGVGAATSNSEPGSTGDPLVTKSYLEQVIREMGGSNQGSSSGSSNGGSSVNSSDIDELQLQIDNMQTKLNQAAPYKKIKVAAGKTITGSTGAEIILYSGTAVTSTSYKTGIIDLVQGKCIVTNQNLVKYHPYLIATKSSIKIKTAGTVLIKGAYTLK